MGSQQLREPIRKAMAEAVRRSGLMAVRSWKSWRGMEPEATQTKQGPFNYIPGGGFRYFLFSPLFGEDFQFDYYFSRGLKPPTRLNYLIWDQRMQTYGDFEGSPL